MIMKDRCSKCPNGPNYNPLSDWCDGCMEDPNTGFGGFYDHRVGKEFMTKDEQKEYYKKHHIMVG